MKSAVSSMFLQSPISFSSSKVSPISFMDGGLSVIRFSQRGRKDYYTTDSTNVRKAFLRTPIEFARISSHYNPNRKHPVLNTIRAHKGTDYAAKTGTEVVTTGDGIVKEAKFSRSYGNYIDIMHYNKYLTRYAHLNDLIKQKSENIIVGNPLDPKTNIGPLCTSKQIEIIENTINKSCKN